MIHQQIKITVGLKVETLVQRIRQAWDNGNVEIVFSSGNIVARLLPSPRLIDEQISVVLADSAEAKGETTFTLAEVGKARDLVGKRPVAWADGKTITEAVQALAAKLNAM